MKLYHYAVTPFDHLMSRVAQGVGVWKPGPWHYDKSISLFMEPIPRNLASILKHKHSFWRQGAMIIEHVIDSSEIPVDIFYHLVETPERTTLLYEKQNWSRVATDPSLKDKYLDEIDNMEISKGYKDRGRNNMIVAAKRYNTDIERYYRKMLELDKMNPEDGLLKKYAACVPHLMIYPDKAAIKVDSREIIRLT